MRRRLYFWVVILGTLGESVSLTAPRPFKKVPVLSVALWSFPFPHHPRPDNGPSADILECVVIGTARQLSPAGQDRNPVAELTVERVVCGYCTAKKIKIAREVNDQKRQLFWLLHKPIDDGKPYFCGIRGNVEETESIAAIWQAYQVSKVLSSKHIFVGRLRTILAGRDKIGIVEVERSLVGSVGKKGDTVAVSLNVFYIPPKTVPPMDQIPRIFFVYDKDEKQTVVVPEKVHLSGPLYGISYSSPLCMEPFVREMLSRRSEFPVSTKVSEFPDDLDVHTIPPHRMVIYLGPIERAISMLGCEYYPVQIFAIETLFHRRRESTKAIVQTIEREMLTLQLETPNRSQQLQHLVHLLGLIAQCDKSEVLLHGLFDRFLRYLESNLAGRSLHPNNKQHLRAKLNSTLTWLAQEMDSEKASVKYGKRLLKLHDSLDGPWQQEIELTLEVLGIKIE